MKYRFLLHSLSHTIVVVDITGFVLPTEVYPAEGQPRMVLALRFQSWRFAAEHLLVLGADTELLKTTATWLEKAGVAVLTIVET